MKDHTFERRRKVRYEDMIDHRCEWLVSPIPLHTEVRKLCSPSLGYLCLINKLQILRYLCKIRVPVPSNLADGLKKTYFNVTLPSSNKVF